MYAGLFLADFLSLCDLSHLFKTIIIKLLLCIGFIIFFKQMI